MIKELKFKNYLILVSYSHHRIYFFKKQQIIPIPSMPLWALGETLFHMDSRLRGMTNWSRDDIA